MTEEESQQENPRYFFFRPMLFLVLFDFFVVVFGPRNFFSTAAIAPVAASLTCTKVNSTSCSIASIIPDAVAPGAAAFLFFFETSRMPQYASADAIKPSIVLCSKSAPCPRLPDSAGRLGSIIV